MDSILSSATIQGASPCCHESSTGEASKKSCLNEDLGQEQPESTTILMPSHGTSRAVNSQTMPSVIVKSENGNKVALHGSELSLAMGWVIFLLHSEVSVRFKSFLSVGIEMLYHHIAD